MQEWSEQSAINFDINWRAHSWKHAAIDTKHRTQHIVYMLYTFFFVQLTLLWAELLLLVQEVESLSIFKGKVHLVDVARANFSLSRRVLEYISFFSAICPSFSAIHRTPFFFLSTMNEWKWKPGERRQEDEEETSKFPQFTCILGLSGKESHE